jgi:microcystin-dependent protein
MGSPYVGEIQYVGFSFAPIDWAFCNGQLMSIAQNEALYALIGTIYGGDGVATFALPDMQGRVPIHFGTGQGLSTYAIGQKAGNEETSLTTSQMPQHTHTLVATTNTATTQAPGVTSVLAAGHDGAPNGVQIPKIYLPANTTNVGASVNLAANSVSNTGGNIPVSLIQPILAVNCIIALFGVFPSHN